MFYIAIGFVPIGLVNDTFNPAICLIQGFGSGSVLDPYSIGPLDPDPDPGGQK